MPLTSAVGRVEICSISRRSFSPAGIFSPIGPRNFSARQPEPGEVGLDVGRQIVNAVIETGNGDRAVRLVHRRKNVGEHVDRIARRTAEQSGMQIAVGAGEPDLLVDQAAQRGRDRGRLRIPHAGIADQRKVAFELGGVVAHEAEQVFRAALLLALDHHRNVERQLAGHRLEGAASLDEGHGLAFVVASAARDDDFAAAVERLDARLERRRLPQIERIDRLHVIMAVEQDPRRLAVGLTLALPSPLLPAGVLPMTTGWPSVGRTLASKPRLRRSAATCSAAVRQCAANAGSVETDWMRSSANRRSRLASRSRSMRSSTAGRASSAVMGLPTRLHR